MRPSPAAAAPPTRRVNVNVWSDIACPWCYVGKRRLDAATRKYAEARPDVAVDVQWHPFIIDLNTRPEGEEYLAYNLRRWGSDSWTRDLRRSGAPDGATFSNWTWWPNTVKAHQVVLLAERARPGGGAAAKELLLRATYEEGRNVSLLDELEALVAANAALLGLEPVAVREALQGQGQAKGAPGGLREELMRRDTEAKKKMKISGVPFFIITAGDGATGKAHALSGAQPVARLVAAFDRALLEEEEAAVAEGAGAAEAAEAAGGAAPSCT